MSESAKELWESSRRPEGERATKAGESEQDINGDCDRQRAEILARGDELRRQLDETEKTIKGASVYSDPGDLSALVGRSAALVTLLELVQPSLNRVEEERQARIFNAREPQMSDYDKRFIETYHRLNAVPPPRPEKT
jgi:hypothetical protein